MSYFSDPFIFYPGTAQQFYRVHVFCPGVPRHSQEHTSAPGDTTTAESSYKQQQAATSSNKPGYNPSTASNNATGSTHRPTRKPQSRPNTLTRYITAERGKEPYRARKRL